VITNFIGKGRMRIREKKRECLGVTPFWQTRKFRKCDAYLTMVYHKWFSN
jgi:hypothetical protein